MRKEERIDKETIVNALIDNLLEEKHPEEIKTSYIDKYENPAKLKIKGSDEAYTPDVAVSFGDSSNLYEIELDDNFQINKWKLFSLHAQKRNGNLYLIVPEWLRDSVKNELTSQKINAGIIFFNT